MCASAGRSGLSARNNLTDSSARRTRSSAACVACSRTMCGRRQIETCRAIVIAATGDGDRDGADRFLASVPPEGPAMPVTLTPRSACSRWRTPSAIAAATGSLTAPCSVSSSAARPAARACRSMRDDAARHPLRAARHVRQAAEHEPAGARLGDRHALAGVVKKRPTISRSFRSSMLNTMSAKRGGSRRPPCPSRRHSPGVGAASPTGAARSGPAPRESWFARELATRPFPDTGAVLPLRLATRPGQSS